MSFRVGTTLKSRKTGRADVKLAVVRKDTVQLHNTATGRRWWTSRENVKKSFVTS